MNPVDSDKFQSSDFANTFAILDANPGIRTVANYSALTALTYGIPQHGSPVLQLDNGALWYWYNPSGTGSWKRLNNVGLLKNVVQNADVSTSTITGNGVLVVSTGNVVVPGGRALRVDCTLGLDATSGESSLVVCTLFDNGAQQRQYTIRAGLVSNSLGNSSLFSFFTGVATPASTHNWAMYIRASNVNPNNGGHGTVSSRTSSMAVSEV